MGEAGAVLGGDPLVDRAPAPGQCDDELVARVRAGDPAAFEQIYDRYARGILAFCVHMLGNREAAEDALQLTFVSAYRALRGGQSSIALRPWLYTIARNRCLSEIRARRDVVGVDTLITDHPAIEGLADQVQRREDLREMLDDMRRLPADQRAALVLFELGDQPQKEIATVLGVRTEKVKALVFQAREALVRGRKAREHPCPEIREQMATLEGRIPARSMLRAHIERCPGCQSFEHEVRHQRAALALILPVPLTVELKSWILGSAFHGHAVAAGVGACGGGGGVVAAGACGGGTAAGSATVVGGLGGSGALTATAASGIVGTGAGAVASGAPAVVAAAGLTAAGETVTGLSATGVVAKLLTAAAIATVAASSSHSDKSTPRLGPTPATARQSVLASAITPAGARTGQTANRPSAAGAPTTATATPLGSPGAASSGTPAGSSGSTSSSGPPTASGAGTLVPPGTAGGTSADTGTPQSGAASPPSTATSPSPTPAAPATEGSPPAPPSAGTADPTPPGPSSSPGASASPSDSNTPTAAATTTPAPADSSGSGSTPPPASSDTGSTAGAGTSSGTTSSSADSSGASAPAASPAMTPATSSVNAPNGSGSAGAVASADTTATAGP